MQFDPKEIILKDGRKCILRPATAEDAEVLVKYLKETAGETEYLLRYPDEINLTVEDEQAFLGRILDDPGAVMMVATIDGNMAGNCSISGSGAKRKMRHRCTLAIALYKEYWHLGNGTAMIAHLAELARLMGYQQMDLEVVAENTMAQALYAKCGFMESRRRHHALRFDDGSMHDEILMYREL